MNRIRTTAYRNRLQAFSAAILVALIALTGATWMTLTAPAEAATVVQLDRVVISGAHTPDTTPDATMATASTTEVQQLPRVIVVGRRDTSTDTTQVASACTAPAVC